MVKFGEPFFFPIFQPNFVWFKILTIFNKIWKIIFKKEISFYTFIHSLLKRSFQATFESLVLQKGHLTSLDFFLCTRSPCNNRFASRKSCKIWFLFKFINEKKLLFNIEKRKILFNHQIYKISVIWSKLKIDDDEVEDDEL